MSLQATEQECASVAKAPRVSLTDIEAAISKELYTTADRAFIEVLSKDFTLSVAEFRALEIFTICLLVLKNGFTVMGQSAPASPENFNAELGRKLAREHAIRKLWPLMGFALRNDLYRNPKRVAEVASAKPSPEVTCEHPNDCQFPACTCGNIDQSAQLEALGKAAKTLRYRWRTERYMRRPLPQDK